MNMCHQRGITHGSALNGIATFMTVFGLMPCSLSNRKSFIVLNKIYRISVLLILWFNVLRLLLCFTRRDFQSGDITIIVVMLFSNIVLPVLGTINFSKLPSMFSNIEYCIETQKEIEHTRTIITRLVYACFLYVAIVCILFTYTTIWAITENITPRCIALGPFEYLLSDLGSPGALAMEAIYSIFVIVHHAITSCYLCIFVCICLLIRHQFKACVKDLASSVAYTEELLENFRLHHQATCRLLFQFERVMTPYILLELSVNIALLCFLVYYSIYAQIVVTTYIIVALGFSWSLAHILIIILMGSEVNTSVSTYIISIKIGV